MNNLKKKYNNKRVPQLGNSYNISFLNNPVKNKKVTPEYSITNFTFCIAFRQSMLENSSSLTGQRISKNCYKCTNSSLRVSRFVPISNLQCDFEELYYSQFLITIHYSTMVKFLFVVLNLFKEWFGQIVFSIYYFTHLGRGGFFCYKHLGIDMMTIIIFSILAFGYLIQSIWRLSHFEDKKSKRIYLSISVGIHLLFNLFFFYEHWKHPNKNLLVFSIVVYWMLEGAIHLWMIYKQSKS